jgi:hypothetical protein
LQKQDIDLKFVNLLNLLKRLRESPQEVLNTDREELIANARANLPPIWLTWPMLILLCFRSRIRAVRGIGRLIREALVEGVPDDGLELKEDGSLTSICEWDYSIADGSAVLMNRVTGESIEAWDSDPYDIVYPSNVMEAMKNSGDHSPAYERGRALFASIAGISGVFELLERHGVLVREGPDALKLHPTLIWHQDEVDALIDRLRDYPEMWDQLSAAIGDLPYLAESTQLEEIRRLADECQLEWRETLSAEADQNLTADLVHALADAGGLEPHLADALSKEATAEAAVVYAKDDPQWCGSVWALFTSSECCRWGCADYLTQHGHHTEEVLTELVAREWHYKHAIELSLSHAPQLTLSFLREGLRSGNREHRQTAAAVLALIGHTWSWNELANPLHESADWEKTSEARAVLRTSSNETNQALVESWESEHDDVRPSFDLGRIALANVMEEWADFVSEVRDTIPDP